MMGIENKLLTSSYFSLYSEVTVSILKIPVSRDTCK